MEDSELPSPTAFDTHDRLDLGAVRPTHQPLPTVACQCSFSLEEGEIVEEKLPRIDSESLLPSQQPNARTSTPPSATMTVATHKDSSCASTSELEPMTEADLDHAKSLVLDLLGWGVTPEYIIECGVSPGAVYKIFTDLRLRLPSNLRLVSRYKLVSNNTLALFH